jgi:anhydro-N-acetylmuramic acid kinase
MKKQFSVLGIMSGTSLDGMDIAHCIFEQDEHRWKYTIEDAKTYPYTKQWKRKLASATRINGLKLTFLDNELGQLTGKFVNDFLKNKRCKIDFIASHGHTVFHQPHKKMTLQIGSGAEIAATTGITTICDFRTMDVALGGHGAPLVPIGDKLLFAEFPYCLNLGGFANISYDNIQGERIAFDVCPVNIVINQLVSPLNLSYDPEGSVARKGKVNELLLKQLNELSFYHQSGPKSLGKEWVNQFISPLLSESNLTIEDTLRTFYEHITIQIKNITSEFPSNKILVTGGGAHNSFLMELFREKIHNTIAIPDKTTINFKEALIFAFLGVLRYNHQANCLKSVTGAIKNNIGGAIYQPV